MTAPRIIFLPAVVALLLSCGKKIDGEAEYSRSLAADSTKAIITADSLFALADTLEGPISLLKQPNLRKSKHESYRLSVAFSWGQSPVGPLFSAMAQNRDSVCVLVTISFPEPERKRTESVKEISRENFMRIAQYFDSINFQNMPRTIYSDVQVMDADRYYVESVSGGRYHQIVRTRPIERTVYDLWAAMLTVVEFDPALIKVFRDKSEVEK